MEYENADDFKRNPSISSGNPDFLKLLIQSCTNIFLTVLFRGIFINYSNISILFMIRIFY